MPHDLERGPWSADAPTECGFYWCYHRDAGGWTILMTELWHEVVRRETDAATLLGTLLGQDEPWIDDAATRGPIRLADATGLRLWSARIDPPKPPPYEAGANEFSDAP